MISVLDVIRIHDDVIRPPGPKMVVCICPSSGLFFRINTDSKWQTPVLLKLSLHPFLSWDSYLECGEPLELDDYIVNESLNQGRGVIGRIDCSACQDIWNAVRAAKQITQADKGMILSSLQTACPSIGLTP